MAISCKLRTITGNASLGIHWTSRGCRTMREGKPENNQGDKLANLERAEAEMMMVATASIPRLVSICDV